MAFLADSTQYPRLSAVLQWVKSGWWSPVSGFGLPRAIHSNPAKGGGGTRARAGTVKLEGPLWSPPANGTQDPMISILVSSRFAPVLHVSQPSQHKHWTHHTGPDAVKPATLVTSTHLAGADERRPCMRVLPERIPESFVAGHDPTWTWSSTRWFWACAKWETT
ncbi:hypothetical protein VTJ04DRAFT_3233 [Mycothermus thermophilus]|uniref:uncharacterized protein n=1 Tax=Humicola insolens TaxID=85995 RepID=UPI003744716B